MRKIVKFISFLLVILLTLTGLPTNISAASNSGETLRELGVLKGDLSGNLLLDQPLKRQDVVVLLSRLLGEEETAENYPGIPTFTDIEDPYYIPFIAWAEDSGLTEGIGGGLFGYDDFLTNQQLMAFLLRALDYEFYGADYGLVPGKAYEMELSPDGEQWGETTTRQTMADRTVTLLRIGRIKATNVTLERHLALRGSDFPGNGQLFTLTEAEISNGLLVASFAQNHNSSRSNRTSAIMEEGPDTNDIRLTVEISDRSTPVILDLEKQFYDSTTGVMLASFEQPEIPDEGTVEVKINYLEDRELIGHELTHVVQQRSPETYEPGELILILEEILGDILQTGTGNFSGDEFNDDTADALAGISDNPLYKENSMSGTNPMYETEGSISGGSGEIILGENVTEPMLDNFFTIILQNGEKVECCFDYNFRMEGNTIITELDNLNLSKEGTIEVLHAYVNTNNLAEEYARNYGFTVEVARSIIEDLIINLHKASKTGTLSSTYAFGLLTIHSSLIDFNTAGLKTMHGVIVGTERTNPELENKITVAIPTESEQPELRTYSLFDYGKSFRSDDDAVAYFNRYLDPDYLDPDDDGDGIDTVSIDPDSDGDGIVDGLDDGLDDLVFTKDKKPVRVTKTLDKASPLLFAADGGLGEHVTLYMENGKVMFWTDGGGDCDDSDREIFPTETFVDTLEMSISKRSARTGRNPQTGKEIKITANTQIVIDHADGSVTTSTLENPDTLLETKSSFPYARVVTDENDNALFIHIIQDAVVVYVESKELDKSSPKIIYTNTDDLTDEEIDFILSDEHNITKFVFRQEFGPVNGSSSRIYNKRQFAEFIDYTTEEKAAAKTPRFKAGAELSKTAAPGTGEDNDCDLILVGDPPSMDGHVELGDIPEGTRAILVVDSFFDIFTEVSADFRGHVTVLK